MSQRVLVTGGAGFIGSHVADAYLQRGDQVWILDDLSSGRMANVPANARFVKASITEDAVDRVFQEAGGFDIVNHHAAQMDVRTSVERPRFDAAINVDGFLNVVECARKYNTRRVLFVSSGGVVYGEPEQRPTPEDAPKAPLSPYGVTKLTAEYYLNYYRVVHGLEYAALRYANVYGPRQNPHGEAGVVAIFSSRLREQKPFTIYGDGHQTRDYVYIADVVQANMLLSDVVLAPGGDLDQRAFNVGTGRETSVNDLARTLIAVSGVNVDVHHAAERRGELRHSALDTKRLQTLGWSVRHSLEDGLRVTYDYIANKETGW
ncbi:MAG TPA: NAD-dependent epimerase/dehydratase family protein [Longimicrobiales bacterium]